MIAENILTAIMYSCNRAVSRHYRLVCASVQTGVSGTHTHTAPRFCRALVAFDRRVRSSVYVYMYVYQGQPPTNS